MWGTVLGELLEAFEVDGGGDLGVPELSTTPSGKVDGP
jgi:hypothetical protein